MDPNANLREQLELAADLMNGKGSLGDGERLAYLVVSLHEWISNNGVLPEAWEN